MSIAFDRAAGFYDESRGLDPEVSERVADRVEEAAGRRGRLLEVGVGTGRIALPLHRRGRRVVGIGLSVPVLERYPGQGGHRGPGTAGGGAGRVRGRPRRPGHPRAGPPRLPVRATRF